MSVAGLESALRAMRGWGEGQASGWSLKRLGGNWQPWACGWGSLQGGGLHKEDFFSFQSKQQRAVSVSLRGIDSGFLALPAQPPTLNPSLGQVRRRLFKVPGVSGLLPPHRAGGPGPRDSTCSGALALGPYRTWQGGSPSTVCHLPEEMGLLILPCHAYKLTFSRLSTCQALFQILCPHYLLSPPRSCAALSPCRWGH